MFEKQGRERQFQFDDPGISSDPGTRWMVGMWLELGDRVFDQIEHLPSDVLHGAPEGSYLIPARIVLHLVGNDLRLLPLLVGVFPPPAYQPLVAATTATDLQSMETRSVDVRDVLAQHLVFRKALPGLRNLAPEFLEASIEHPSFATKRAALGHLIWHWSFHGGHIGAVTLEMGHEYIWRSSLRAPTR
jgi:hypothetical protein